MTAYIFDCDGIIVDSEDNSKKSTCLMFRNLGIDFTKEDLEFCLGRRWEDLFPHFSRKYNIIIDTAKALKFKQKEYEILCYNMKTFPGIKEIITQIKNKGYKIGIATSGTKRKLDFNLEKAGLQNVFDELTSCEEVSNGKPKPDIYLLTAKKMDVSPKECVVFEDSPAGVRSAKSAGMFVVAVTNSVSKEQLHEADLIIDNISDYKVN